MLCTNNKHNPSRNYGSIFSYIHTKGILNQNCLTIFHLYISAGQKIFSFNFVQGKHPPQAKISYVKSSLRVNYKLLIIRLYINGSMIIALTIIWCLWFQLHFAQCNISSGVSLVINQNGMQTRARKNKAFVVLQR